MAFLDLAGEDWDIAVKIVEHARKGMDERRHLELKNVIEALGNSIGNKVAEQIGRMFR